MNPFDLPLLAAVLHGAYSALLTLTALLQPVAGPVSATAAIVLTTLIVRTVLIPVGISTARAEQTRARLAPRLRLLRERHRHDPERLQRETMRLYRDEGTSPFGGCLPLLAQAPLVGLLYAVFLHPVIDGAPNELLGQTLFGVPLGTGFFAALTGGTLDAGTALVIGVIVVAIAAVGELTRRLLRPVDTAGAPAGVPGGLLGALQFATAAGALFVPLAAGVYLLVTVSWTLVQRLILRRRFPVR